MSGKDAPLPPQVLYRVMSVGCRIDVRGQRSSTILFVYFTSTHFSAKKIDTKPKNNIGANIYIYIYMTLLEMEERCDPIMGWC